MLSTIKPVQHWSLQFPSLEAPGNLWWVEQRWEFLDALASLDFKLSVSQWVSNSPFSASASTGLSDYLMNILDFKQNEYFFGMNILNFKKMNICFEWIFWFLKKWIVVLNEYSGFL